MATTPTQKTILNKYLSTKILGRGNFAKVYHARSIIDSTKTVAIKVINKTKTDKYMGSLIVREIEAMRRIDHPNVLKIHEVMASKSKIYLVMEFAKGGDLFTKQSRRPDRRFTEPIARRFFHQIVSALKYCHSNGVAHRDIKPQNILLDGDNNVKIADFGLSGVGDPTVRDLTLNTACGTPAFAAPEIVGRTRCRVGYDGCKADAWSCGVILFVMLCGFLPFDDSNLVLMFRKMHKRDFRFPNWVSKGAKCLIIRLLDPNPKTRIGIEEVMDDPWLKNHGLFYSRSVSLGDIAILEERKYQGRESKSSMNAFEIISMSSGLDLSGIFDERKGRKEKRYTSRESKGIVVEKVVEVGEKLGYEVETSQKSEKGSCCVVLGKGRLVLSVVVSEVASELVVVELKVVNASGWDQEKELHWGDLISGLGDLVVSWNQ